MTTSILLGSTFARSFILGTWFHDYSMALEIRSQPSCCGNKGRCHFLHHLVFGFDILKGRIYEVYKLLVIISLLNKSGIDGLCSSHYVDQNWLSSIWLAQDWGEMSIFV